MKTGFIFLLLLSSLSGCDRGKNQHDGIPQHILKMDNITIYSVPDHTETETASLAREQSFGDTDDVHIRRIGGINVDSSGRVYILDSASGSKTIHVFDPDGRYITNLGREGEGPGEFSAPGCLRIYSKKLFVYDYELNRLTSYSTETLELLEIVNVNPDQMDGAERIKGMRFTDYHFLDEKTLLIGFKRFQKYFEDEPGTYHYYIVDDRFREPGPEVFKQDALLESWGDYRGMRIMKMFPFHSKPLRAVTESGRIFLASSDEFLIREYTHEGNEIGGFYYPVEKINVTREDALTSSNEMTEEIARQVELPDYWPVLESMHSDDEERLWISTYTEAGNEFQWWILESSGKLVAQFRRPGNRYAEPHINSNIINMARNGYFYTLEKNEETGTAEVVQYRVEIEDVES